MSQRKNRQQAQEQASQTQPPESQPNSGGDAQASEGVVADSPPEDAPSVPVAAPQEAGAAPSPSERPAPGLSTKNFPLGSPAESPNDEEEQLPQPTPSRPRQYRGDEMGEKATMRVGALSGVEHDIKLPIDGLGFNHSEYVIEFRSEVGAKIPVATVPPRIAEMLRRQSSARRNFAFGLA